MHRHYDLEARRWHIVDGQRVRRFVSVPEGPSLVQKHQAKETDINVIVERFKVTGMAPQRLDRLNLGAFEGIFDYQTAMNAVVEAQRAFMLVPTKVRERFGNDPQKFVEFVTDPENRDELIKLKLADVTEKPVEVVQKVEIVNSVPPLLEPSPSQKGKVPS